MPARWTLWVMPALLALGCGPESNGLSGSLSVVFPLEVSRVDIARNQEALQISYLRNRGTFLDVVARLSVAVADFDLFPGIRIDMSGEYAPGHPRAVVAHAPGGEPVRLLPRVKRGDLMLNSLTTFSPDGGPGQGLTRGSFGILFESEGGELGSGRTLNGTFSAVASDAGFGLP